MADNVLPQGWVVWMLDSQRFALPVGRVARVLPALEVTPLADAPPAVAGSVVLQGRVVAVLDLRRCLGLPLRELQLTDSLVLAQGSGGALAFFADTVQGVLQPADADAAGAVLIRDPWALLGHADRQRLVSALAAHAPAIVA